jgi:Fe-Mn family superoxide dismutase
MKHTINKSEMADLDRKNSNVATYHPSFSFAEAALPDSDWHYTTESQARCIGGKTIRHFTNNSTSPHLRLSLPYAENALEPVISSKTVCFHHGKHHRWYADNLNKLVAGTELAGLPLDKIVKKTVGKAFKTAIFSVAAQTWNHTFYWSSLKPKGGGEPPPVLKQMIDASFGSLDECTKELVNAAMALAGSGWVWLVMDGGMLKVIKTGNTEVWMATGMKPLLTIDVGEHAYYLDYQNHREDYVHSVIDKLINWDFATKNLG